MKKQYRGIGIYLLLMAIVIGLIFAFHYFYTDQDQYQYLDFVNDVKEKADEIEEIVIRQKRVP